MNSLDTNVSNYSDNQLLDILELDYFNTHSIQDKCDEYINYYNNKNDSLYIFFTHVKKRLLNRFNNTSNYVNNSDYISEPEPEPDSDSDSDSEPLFEGMTNINEDVKDTNKSDDNNNSDDDNNSDDNNNSDDDVGNPDNTNNILTNNVESYYKGDYTQQGSKVQSNKATSRDQKINVFGNSSQFPMIQQRLGIQNNYNVPVLQGTINPNLQNTTTRYIMIDSQFRPFTDLNTYLNDGCNFTINLSEKIHNVISIKLNSYQIPYSWYNIDASLSNNCFWIVANNITYNISLTSGNYTNSTLETEVNTQLANAGFDGAENACQINSSNNIMTLALFGLQIYNIPETDSSGDIVYDTNGNVTYSDTPYIVGTEGYNDRVIFYDTTNELYCASSCSNTGFTDTFGWLAGYRVTQQLINSPTIVGSSVVNLVLTKYLALQVNDYNQNRVNTSLIGIQQPETGVDTPKYPNLPFRDVTCELQDQLDNYDGFVNTIESIIPDSTIGDAVDDRLSELQNNIETNLVQYMSNTYEPTFPRTMTRNQLYATNEIVKNKKKNNNSRKQAPSNSDVLVVLPVNIGNATPGTVLTSDASSLQTSVRRYFGPVNIQKIQVALLSDKGNPINLNGTDWSFTLVAECLYQY